MDVQARRTAVVGVLVAAGGAAIGAAQALRWSRCLADVDGNACVEIQNHTFDYQLPTDPWVPVAGAAQLDGAGHLLVAAALLLGAAPYRAPSPGCRNG